MVDPVTAIAVGSSIAEGLGGIAGAFGGGGYSSKDKVIDRNIDFRYNARDARKMPSHVVEGWKRAGIHPLAGITGGVNLGSGGTTSTIQDTSNVGQNISRAAKSVQSAAGRVYQRQMENLSIERAKLENELLRGQITKVHTQQVTPAIGQGNQYTVDGQGNAKAKTPKNALDNRIDVLADEVISKSGKNPEMTAGLHSFYKKMQLGKDSYINMPSQGELESYGIPYATIKSLELLAKIAGVELKKKVKITKHKGKKSLIPKIRFKD